MRVVLRGEPRLPFENYDPKVDAALLYAAVKHGAQRYGARPYTSHLASVMVTAAELGFTSTEHLCVAALHDVLEDTAASARDIEQRFGAEVLRAVKQLTRDKGAPLDAYFSVMGPLAFAVKIADRISNLRQHGREAGNLERQATHLFPKYEREQPYFRRHALAKDPRFKSALIALEAELDAARRRLIAAGSPPCRALPQLR